MEDGSISNFLVGLQKREAARHFQVVCTDQGKNGSLREVYGR
jgi:hypothetical protein